MPYRNRLTAARLRKEIKYFPKTGKFVRISSRSHKAPVGSNPCSLTFYGYHTISVGGTRYQASRLAWLYMTGRHPKFDIDHKDGNKTNNKFSNLRDVKRRVNLENFKRAKSNNKSTGLLGVYLRKDTGKFSAKITVCGKPLQLGCFNTAEGAARAYLNAKRLLHKGYVL